MIYLDHAATARYLPVGVVKEYVKVASAKCNPGRGSYREAVDLGLKVYRVRESIKRYLHAPRHEVAFCKNCTEALNLAIRGYLTHGGRVVTTVTEHNSVLRPLHHLTEEGKITYVTVAPSSPDKGVEASAIERALTPDTALVVVNLVSNVTGVSNDVPAIGALLSRRGIPLLVDGAQGVGHIPVDVAAWGVDMLACPAHKGLHGLSGGFLLTNRSLAPLLYGGTGTASQSLRQPHGVDGWEAGTQDYAGICALGKGVEWTYAHLDRLISHEEGLISYLSEELSTIERVHIYGHGHD
ncbi:MAG: aminotransferase class V-fold PLP-dependent enzyme, partial [Clostridia bacterium]|nr:aminotransferase class V-fold PLP-dependent enzyme [Clostridia bacterium]